MTISLCSDKSNKKAHILPPRVIHCEADKATPDLFAVRPSFQVETSPGRHHLYWQLKEPVPVAKAEMLSKRIAYSQRAHGADFGWAANKLLRVPGTTNTKPDYKRPKVKLTEHGYIYTYKEIKKKFDAVALSTPTNQEIPFPKVLPKLAGVLDKIPTSKEVLDLIYEPATSTHWNPEGSRYVVLWKLACTLFRKDFTREEVFVVCRSSANNKYEQDGRDQAELWRDVLKAEEEVKSAELGIVFVEGVDGEDPIKVVLDVPAGVNLLTKQERKQIEPNWFIEEYVAWASSKTLADRNYHHANAITLLSTVLSEWGYATPKHGALDLHLWFMILGVTSTSYKTTAAKLMMRVVKILGKNKEIPYELAADPTPEALSAALANRGETSNLFHVDEAQGLVSDSKGGKSYMSGFLRLLTQLYDGEVPARERIMSTSTKATKTNVTLNLLGVPGKMTEALSREDFASGFLARFIFVLGKPAPRDAKSRYMSQSPLDENREADPVIYDLAMALQLIGNKWMKRAAKRDGKFPIRVEDDAWERWNKFVLDMDEIAFSSADVEAVLPTAQRTTVSVHKLACLLAMAESEFTVTMKHMLTAIHYAEMWFDTMMLVTTMVSENRWAKQVTDLVEFVGNKKVSWNSAYRHFSGLKVREFDEIVESATQSGRITTTKESKGAKTVVYLQKAGK